MRRCDNGVCKNSTYIGDVNRGYEVKGFLQGRTVIMILCEECFSHVKKSPSPTEIRYCLVNAPAAQEPVKKKFEFEIDDSDIIL